VLLTVRGESGFCVDRKVVIATSWVHMIKEPSWLCREHTNPATAGAIISSGVIALVLGKSSPVGMGLVVRKLFVGVTSRC
jgi:hypothetical protein